MIKIKTNKYPWFKYYKDMKSTLKYPDTSMYELVKRACIKYPSNIAYTYFGTKVTYKSLLRKIDLCAQSYAKIGVVKNSNVTIENTLESHTDSINALTSENETINEFMKDRNGVVVRYKEEIKHQRPEFIKVYFEWLKEKKNSEKYVKRSD